MLVLATAVVYLQVAHFDFVNFDDPDYITRNPHVTGGLTFSNIAWAFSSGEAANWFPLTWLSHMLDCQLFGLNSGWHHVTNLFFHVMATLLLFLFLERATKAQWRSAAVGFLFALHPLHVESVAWIAERKDVLSAFFWFLTLWAYVWYTERPGWRRYLLVLGSFCFGLLAKPMGVTLPFVLLLLDGWPLRRTQVTWRKKIWEKAPFLLVAGVIATVTYLVQGASGAVQGAETFPLAMRVENALISYVVYLAKMFWPVDLAVFYPYPKSISIWQPVFAAVLLAGLSAFVIWSGKSRPYLPVGWLWYLGTLVPVIGLVQVGAQARADRYTYVPLVGLFIILVWGAKDLVERWPRARKTAMALAAVGCSGCVVLTAAQIENWRDSESLFRHALAVTDGNYLAEHNLGVALTAQPRALTEAVQHLEAAVMLDPNNPRAHTDLGNALVNMPGRLSDAVAEYRAALQMAPDAAITHNDLGNTLLQIPGHTDEAIAEYKAALRLKPDYAEAHNNLGRALSEEPGRLPEAISEYEAALRLKPDYALARRNLDAALANDPKRLPEAIAHQEASLQEDPNSAEAHSNLASALAQVPGRLGDAIAEYQTALRLNPNSAEVHYNLGVALARTQEGLPDAIAQYEEALRLKPDYAEAENNLGVAYSQIVGRLPEAIEHLETAVRLRPDFADAHYNLGIALSNMPGRRTDAIREFEAAQRLKPDAEVEQALERLRAER